MNGTLRHVVTTGTGAESMTSTGQGSVKFVQDEASSSGSQIVFRPDPSSTCSVVIDGTQGGCAVHATSTMCTFITDRSALAVSIDSSTDPPTYMYNAMVGANVTLHESINCPGGPNSEFDVTTIESLMMAPATEHFTVDADGKTLRNSYAVGMAPLTETWTWDLTLDPRPTAVMGLGSTARGFDGRPRSGGTDESPSRSAVPCWRSIRNEAIR